MSGTDKRGNTRKNKLTCQCLSESSHSMHDTNLFRPCRTSMTQRKRRLATNTACFMKTTCHNHGERFVELLQLYTEFLFKALAYQR